MAQIEKIGVVRVLNLLKCRTSDEEDVMNIY